MRIIQTWIKSGRAKKLVVFLILLSFFISPYVFADESIITGILEYKDEQSGFFQGDFYDAAGTSAADWYALSAGRLGLFVDSQAYVDYMEKNEAFLTQKKVTDYARQTLSLVSLAYDPRNSLGEDLLAVGMTSKTLEQLVEQGLNGAIFSLLALDSHHFSLEGASFSRIDLLALIASHQQSDGGFALWLGESDVDITAMCIQALAPYQNLEQPISYEGAIAKQKETKRIYDVISDALVFLQQAQKPNGEYLSWGVESQESLAQVLIALYSIGREDSFRQSLWEVFIAYQNDDGGFFHSRQEDEDNLYAKAFVSNPMSSEQALLATIARLRSQRSLNRLYDMVEERDFELQEEILSLNEDIVESSMSDEKLYERYLQLSADDRSYVSNYEILRERVLKEDYFVAQDDLIEVMGQEEVEFYQTKPLIETKYTQEKQKFDQEDLQRAKEIIASHTLDDRMIVDQLIYRYDREREVEDEQTIKELRAIQKQMNQKLNEVEEFNQKLLALYPLENLSEEKQEVVATLFEQTKSFDTQQIALIGGYEDLKQAAAQLLSGARSKIVRIGIVVLVLLLLLFIIRIVYKRRKEKNWKDQDLQ